MDVAAAGPDPSRTGGLGRRPHIGDLMWLIAGVALGFWLVVPDLKDGPSRNLEQWMLVIVGILGGLSLVGPPLILRARLGQSPPRRRLGPGEVAWFTQGMASWLLWPPVVYERLNGRKLSDTMSGVCYYYGTPLVALYVTCALLAGGWLRKRRRRRPLAWRERFGLVLALLWACVAFYILQILYRDDFGK